MDVGEIDNGVQGELQGVYLGDGRHEGVAPIAITGAQQVLRMRSTEKKKRNTHLRIVGLKEGILQAIRSFLVKVLVVRTRPTLKTDRTYLNNVGDCIHAIEEGIVTPFVFVIDWQRRHYL
jgi:hypothetical protein